MKKVRGYLFGDSWDYGCIYERYDDEYNESSLTSHKIDVKLPNEKNYESLSGPCIVVVPARNKEENK